MRGHEPGGENHSTDSGGVGDLVSSQGLNGEQPQEADGDGCLGTVKDRPAEFVAAELRARIALLEGALANAHKVFAAEIEALHHLIPVRPK